MATIYIHESGIAADVKDAVDSMGNIFEKKLKSVDGKIWIIPSIDIHSGTGLHDVDILLIGYLNDEYCIDIDNFNDIQIKSFFTTIEVKSHSADGIYRDGQRLFVKYSGGDKDVSKQSDGQRQSLVNFLYDVLQYKNVPRISNIILLTGIDYDDFENSVGLTNSNILTADYTVDDFLGVIGRQFILRNQGYVDAFKGFSNFEIGKIADIFCAKIDGVDTMSLRRINLLNQECGLFSDIEKNNDSIIVLSGHAGTGKTIMLLQAADMLTKKGHKCLFLTYNTALISDLKHTLSLMPRNTSEIKMESMHAFMIRILSKNNLWDNSKDIEKDFSPAMHTLCRIKDHIYFKSDYEYIFVDEAQDWEKPVPEILKYLFRNSHIVIADGVDQFMMTSEHTEWGTPFVPTLKKSLRQRRNLTVFAKIFASKMGVSWNVEPNNDLPGGRVLIYNAYEPDIHKKLLKEAKVHGCTEYDLMLLAPNSMISNGFSSKEAYRRVGINLYDGIDKSNRDKIYGIENIKNQECRVYTYESCRGLEAWTTVCLRFDELFTTEHPHSYKDIEYTMARKYMLTLWSLIPLTRAVDTLVLIVKSDSLISQVLEEIHKELPDFVLYN